MKACHCHVSSPKGLNIAKAITTNVVLIILVDIVCLLPLLIRNAKVDKNYEISFHSSQKNAVYPRNLFV
jgi:hypothetical protein